MWEENTWDEAAIAKLKRERDEWKATALDRLRIITAIFNTLDDWHRRATHLPEGKSGRRPWLVTDGDIDHLRKWADELVEISLKGPLNDPYQFVCKSKPEPLPPTAKHPNN